MTNRAEPERPNLSPDEAFKLVGNETRVRILRTLGEADGSLSFSDLRDRVGIGQGQQFNYHLDKLVDHFVAKTDDGYRLRQPGQRVVEAVLSGTITEDPAFGPTRVDWSCQFCSAPLEVSYQQERLTVYCSACEGTYGKPHDLDDGERIGALPLPPAGVQGRTPSEVLEAAYVWGILDILAAEMGVCPRCSAPVEHSLVVCEDHDGSEGLCPACDGRYGVHHEARCTNCIYELGGVFGLRLLPTVELLGFLTAHGLHPIRQFSRACRSALGDYDEEVLSVDPFRGRFTFTADDEALTLTVDDDLSVADAERHSVTGR